MHIGVTVRNMGVQSSAEVLKTCTLAAEELGMESVWITDHIAIPPDDAEGSGGRYLDTLTTLAWMAGFTERIYLGSGVLILPYRAKLPTAKQVANIQELSSGRLLLGVGVGWMAAEFKALGIDLAQRGKLSDTTLAFLNTCFAQDVVETNGQPFLFKPRPQRPPILVGGRPPHALTRAVQFGDEWLPMARSPEHIEAAAKTYRELCDAAAKDCRITVMTSLPLHEPDTARSLMDAYQALGATRLVCAIRYDRAEEYAEQVTRLAEIAL